MARPSVTCVTTVCVLLLISATTADHSPSPLQIFNITHDKTLLANIERMLGRDGLQFGDEEDTENEVIRRDISSYFQSVIPPFVITKTKNEQCRRDNLIFLRDLNDFALWAVTMYDSSAKIPSGLLNGNVNQFGDFDRCINIKEAHHGIRGKYCLTYIQVNLPTKLKVPSSLQHIYNLIHSHRVFKSNLNDSGHRVPRYSTINWGLCVPAACTAEDVQLQMENYLVRFANVSGLQIEVKIEPGMCQVKKDASFSTQFKIVAVLMSSFIVVSIVGAIVDSYMINTRASAILSCFSIRRNFSSLFTFKREVNDIATVHGIRMLNSLMLLLSHKSMAMFFSGYTNRTQMSEEISQQWTVLARAAALYTDPFIMMSGMLTGLSFIKSLKKTGSINIKKEYVNRLTRIIPPMAAIILVCTFMLPEIGGGPQWNLTVNHHAEKCKKYWWRNFLFIHNYYGFNDMCLTHTHHIGIDTQLFLLSPFLVWIVHKWRMQGIAALVGLAAFSTGLRYYTTLMMKLSYFIYPGISNLQMIQTADYSYSIPLHRLTIYIMGIILAYIMDYCGKDYKLKTNIRRLGWMLSMSLFYYSYIKPSSMGIMGYAYNEYDAAYYAALSPILWCLVFAWVIFMEHIGYSSVLGEIFSLRFGPIWTRLSYAIYLTQFPIYFYNVGLQKSSTEYSFIAMLNFWEFVVICLASTALTLFVEYPFNNLRRLFLNS